MKKLTIHGHAIYQANVIGVERNASNKLIKGNNSRHCTKEVHIRSVKKRFTKIDAKLCYC